MDEQKNAIDIYIGVLQENLRVLRQAADWDQETLGYLLGVSRQTVNNIENSRSPMTHTQFISISGLLDWKAKEKPIIKNFINGIILSILDQLEAETGQSYKAYTTGSLMDLWMVLKTENRRS